MIQQYLFIDFEFTMPETGSKKRSFLHEIIEVGLVSVLENEIYETFTSFVKPEHNPILSKRCKEFLGITQADVEQGISFSKLVNILQNYYIHGSTTIVTWGNMDMHVLRKNCEFHSIPFPFQVKELDLSIEHKRFYGEQNQKGLIKALTEYGQTENRKHHRALDDALTTYEIYQLIEKDKSLMKQDMATSIGDLVDFKSLLEKFA